MPFWARPGISRWLHRLVPERVGLGVRAEMLARRVARGEGGEADLRILSRFVRPGDTCWDIGANAGSYAVALSALCRQVHAFEPVPHNRQVLELVVRRLGVANVTIHDLALADSEGAAAMHVPRAGLYGGYYLASLSAGGELAVRQTSVDALVAGGLEPPALIKVDVEGAEDRVITGAMGLIRASHPTWLIETFDAAVFERMVALGYTAYVFELAQRLERVSRWQANARNYWFVREAS